MEKRTLWLVGIGLVAVIALVAWWQRPSAIAERALRELGGLQSSGFTVELALGNSQATQAVLGEQGTVELEMAGAFDRTSAPGNLVADVAITTRTESVSVEMGGDLKFIDEAVYFNIKKAPRVIPGLVALKDQWLVVPRGGNREASSEDTTGSLLQNVQRAGREQIGERSTGKYAAEVSGEGVVRFMDSLAELLGTQLTKAQVANLRMSVEEVTVVPVTLWIEPSTGALRQLQSTLQVPDGNTVSLKLTLVDDVDVSYDVPSDAKPLAEALKASQ